jgi:hypothetical protein
LRTPNRTLTHTTTANGELLLLIALITTEENPGAGAERVGKERGTMQNLAGKPDADRFMTDELRKAIIPAVPATHDEISHTEVPFTICGQLGEFRFKRAWYYWVVKGKVPLNVAQELYADPLGHDDVRVAGHCGCPPPEEWVNPPLDLADKWRAEIGLPLGDAIPDHFVKNFDYWKPLYDELDKRITEAPRDDNWFVDTYHIDSLAGLRLFADTLRKHGLVL